MKALIDKVVLYFFVLLAIVLGLKYMKQYVYLTLTLLTLKFVWIILIVLAFLTLMRKRT